MCFPNIPNDWRSTEIQYCTAEVACVCKFLRVLLKATWAGDIMMECGWHKSMAIVIAIKILHLLLDHDLYQKIGISFIHIIILLQRDSTPKQTL